jgi:hypothetical protein
MDTVRGVRADKVLVENPDDGTIVAELPNGEQGVLGADDRAGIAIILTVLRNLPSLTGFNGTIKVAFSREEEIGCVGSSRIDKKFYQGTDLAIVVDRRGNRDIVVGCGQAFCSNAVGYFMEEVSEMCDMDWKCVEGGISDAVTFSENGVNSINLSAGYMNEHTEREFVSLYDMKDTVQLILQAIAVINDFCIAFGEVPEENKWAKSWYGGKGYGSTTYYEDSFNESIWAEVQDDHNGDVYVYEVGEEVVIQQGENEILLSRDSLKDILKQLGSSLK